LEIDNEDHHSSWYAKGEGKSPKGENAMEMEKPIKKERGRGKIMINRHSSASFSYAVQPPKNEEVYKWW
jgi:hypothetical protein